MIEAEQLELVAGRGIAGDRYYNRPANHKGQVTFFAEETWHRLREVLGPTRESGPEVFQRNIIVRNVDLLGLIGTEFEIQDVRFEGAEYCKPCFWMDQAFAPGTFEALCKWNAGGLRARVLTDGLLGKTDPPTIFKES
jgi:MOSC domain-containing protein YiiM